MTTASNNQLPADGEVGMERMRQSQPKAQPHRHWHEERINANQQKPPVYGRQTPSNFYGKKTAH